MQLLTFNQDENETGFMINKDGIIKKQLKYMHAESN